MDTREVAEWMLVHEHNNTAERSLHIKNIDNIITYYEKKVLMIRTIGKLKKDVSLTKTNDYN